MKKLACLAALTLGLTLVAAPALAGNITIHYVGLRQIEYHVACVQFNGTVAPEQTVYQAPGSHHVLGRAQCVSFNIRIENLRGRIERYNLRAGRRYRLFFNRAHHSWQIAPE